MAVHGKVKTIPPTQHHKTVLCAGWQELGGLRQHILSVNLDKQIDKQPRLNVSQLR